ncbi:MAG: DNA translocase FtsK 4TM domain-containing protein [Bacteroidales bacterium]|jgi:S-DNA-T family DNA segregation ATPase FtsK/SpoIIIE
MADRINKFQKNTLKNEENSSPEPPEEKIPKAKKVKEPKVKEAKEKVPSNRFAFFKDERLHKVLGLFFLLAACYFLFAFISYFLTWETDDHNSSRLALDFLFDKNAAAQNWMGRMGFVVSNMFIKESFGVASFLFVLLFLVTGLKLFLNIKLLPIGLTYKYSFFGLIWVSVACGYIFFTKPEYIILGGIFGYESNLWLQGILGYLGTGLLLLFSLLSFLIIAYNLSFRWYKKKMNEIKEEIKEETVIDEDNGDKVISNKTLNKNTLKDGEDVSLDLEKSTIELEVSKGEDDEKKEITDDIKLVEKEKKTNGSDSGDVELIVEPTNIFIPKIEESEEKLAEKLVAELGPFDPKLDLRDFKLPSVNLLDDYESNTVGVQKEELEANKNRIVETLNNYAIQIEKIKATIGPTVTLYEIVPAAGVRISRIKNLEDDIALSLSALGIRIIAPIPGKGTIGIEVPNQRPEIVSMKSILSSDKFLNNNFELPVGLGKTISNESYVADLTKMPHLLVAGATGQGKSVGLNAVLTSLLFKKHPSQLKFVLIDPKRVELTLYSKIERHYLAKLPDIENAIVTDTKQVVRTLNSLCIEMDLRLDLMHDARVRNIKEYNEKFIARRLNPNEGHRFLPYIVLIVDEFADLIIMAGREIETPITRLAQLSRAIGIHLIIATQRPSVNIITGTIKANFPARLAYRVISKIDSRTILDTGGADQLIGRGDMLLSTGSDIIRLQCAFVDIHEVEKITEFIGEQRGYPNTFTLPEYNEENNEETKNLDPSERDELFEEAARIIVTHQQGSTSLLQRKLKLGYNRAGRIVDQLESAGIIGPFEGSKAREVKIKDSESLEQYLRSLQKN